MTTAPCCTSRRIPRPCSGCTSRSMCSAEIPRATHWYSSKPTRASTPACPSPSPNASFSSTWKARCRRSGAMRTPTIRRCHSRSFCRTSAITSTSIEHLGDSFIVRTNWQARNFRLMQVPIGAEADRAAWPDVVAHRDDTFIEDFDVFDAFLARVGAQRRPAQDQHPTLPIGRRAQPSSSSPATRPPTPRRCRSIRSSTPRSCATPIPRSPRRPRCTTTTCAPARRPAQARSGAGQFRSGELSRPNSCSRRRATATQIPVSLVYRKGFVRDGTAPLLQYAYGAYGLSMDPGFSSARLSLLDRGFRLCHRPRARRPGNGPRLV